MKFKTATIKTYFNQPLKNPIVKKSAVIHSDKSKALRKEVFLNLSITESSLIIIELNSMRKIAATTKKTVFSI